MEKEKKRDLTTLIEMIPLLIILSLLLLGVLMNHNIDLPKPGSSRISIHHNETKAK